MTTQKLVNRRFLLVSLGNPAPYADTLHSAGHHALKLLQPMIPSQPAFKKTDLFGTPCKASLGEKYRLIQCPNPMNDSGGFTLRAWLKELSTLRVNPVDLPLVVVHDDLEEELGYIKMRMWNTSHRGHNGVKSLKSKLRPEDYFGAKWARMSIGIGRPDERDKKSVAEFVLRPMTTNEILTLEDKAGQGVLERLAQWETHLNVQSEK